MNTQIEHGPIRIRPMEASDISHHYEAAKESYSELSPWMAWCHQDYSLKESEDYYQLSSEKWEKGTGYNFAILNRENGHFLGMSSLYDINSHNLYAGLSYWIRTSQAGQGYGSLAPLLVAKFGFETVKLARIEVLVALKNVASKKAAERMGAKEEGLLRRRIKVGDRYHDAYMHSLLEEDIKL